MPFRLTPIVKFLLVACVVMFIAQQTADRFLGGNWQAVLGLVPRHFVIDFWFWQLFTYPFLHGEVMHLFLNLMMLVFIGSEIEAVWGRRRFVTYFAVCSTSAGLAYIAMQLFVRHELSVPMVGASGGIFGLLVAYGLMFGERTLLFMLLFPMKAKHFIWILAGVELMTLLFSPGGGLSSVAHMGGMLAGFSYLWIATLWKIRARERSQRPGRRPGFGQKAKPKSNHLKLVINNAKLGAKDFERDEDSDPQTWH